MRNAYMPAMPLDGELWVDPCDTSKGTTTADGLTKREYLAAMALPRIEISAHYDDYDAVAIKAAQMAIATADALLAELEKTK